MVKPTIKPNSECQDLLKVLCLCKPKIMNTILKNCENDLIHIICDCVYNLVKGKVPDLIQEKLNKLAHHKTSLIKSPKKIAIKEKRKIIVQNGGGFLLFLLPLVAPLIAAAVSKIA